MELWETYGRFTIAMMVIVGIPLFALLLIFFQGFFPKTCRALFKFCLFATYCYSVLLYPYFIETSQDIYALMFIVIPWLFTLAFCYVGLKIKPLIKTPLCH